MESAFVWVGKSVGEAREGFEVRARGQLVTWAQLGLKRSKMDERCEEAWKRAEFEEKQP